MQIYHYNSTDNQGGAAKIASNLVKALSVLNVETTLFVQNKTSNSNHIIGPGNIFDIYYSTIAKYLDLLPLTLYPGWNREPFYSAIVPDLHKTYLANGIDIVHLHNITRGFIRLENLLKIKKPIVWSLHDSWAYTGGCSLHKNCDKYKEVCNYCPALNSTKLKDLSFKNYSRKKNIYSELNLTIVCPSKWMAENVRSSSLLGEKEIVVIPNGIDLNIFYPLNKKESRHSLNLEDNKYYILFGANYFYRDKNKGFQYLREALKNIREDIRNLVIITFGSKKSVEKHISNIPVIDFGYIEDDSKMAQLYSSADITIVPSEQESFGLVAIESMACGTPVVCFDVPALNETIKHKVTGYLAKPFLIKDLTEGILWLFRNETIYNGIVKEGIRTVKANYSVKNMTEKYLELYKKVLIKINLQIKLMR